MKLTACFVAAALLVATGTLAQPPASGKVTLATGILRSYDAVKRNLQEAADKMPEADYSFKPTPEIRNYGQLFGQRAVRHLCGGQRGAGPQPGQRQRKENDEGGVRQSPE